MISFYLISFTSKDKIIWEHLSSNSSIFELNNSTNKLYFVVKF